MSDRHAGGAAWLDAVLYDSKRSETDNVLDAYSFGAQDVTLRRAPGEKTSPISPAPG